MKRGDEKKLVLVTRSEKVGKFGESQRPSVTGKLIWNRKINAHFPLAYLGPIR